jgi:hypothetical protein
VTKGKGDNATKEYPNACYLKAFMCQEHERGTAAGFDLKHVQCYTENDCPQEGHPGHEEESELHCFVTRGVLSTFFAGSVQNFNDVFKKLMNSQGNSG